MSQHRLRVSDLIVSDGAGSLVSERGYTLDVYGDGFERGKVVSIDVAIRTALQDGGRVFTESYGLREFKFFVVVGGDSVARAHAEEDLAAVCGIRTEIGWRGPDEYAVESVWDVETSDMPELVEDDFMEVARGEVVYAMRFTCQPFARPNEMTTVAALPVESGVTPETVVIDAGTATTYWAARIGALSDEGSYLQVSTSKSPRAVWTGAAPFDTSGHHYVSLDLGYSQVATGPIYLDADGERAVEVSRTFLPGGGATPIRYTWLVEADSVASMEFGVDLSLVGDFNVANLTASNVPPYYGSTKQTSRTIDVKGSARTQGKLSISAPDGETLGTVLAYTTTNEDVGVPSLRRNRVSGSVPGTDADAISGLIEAMTSGITFDIPVAELRAGKHQMIGHFYASGADTFTVTWTAQAWIDGALAGKAESGSRGITTSGAGYLAAVIDNVNLPPSDLPAASTAHIRITLTCDDIALSFDEGWVFAVGPRVGHLTWVKVGARQRLWIETPTVDHPHPAIYVGNDADQSDAFHAPSLIESWGDHQFFKTTSAFIVTTGTDAAATQFDYFRRYVNTVLEES